MARCVQAARRQAYNIALREVLLTALCGGAFVASKIVEWSEKIHQGLEFSTNTFFWFYYFLTGIHVLHVLVGFVVLAVVVYQLTTPGAPLARNCGDRRNLLAYG